MKYQPNAKMVFKLLLSVDWGAKDNWGMEMILLNDPRVLAVQRQESGETMVSLAGLDARLEVDWSRSQIASDSERFCYARRSVG
ncbi:hypothetical protein KIM372_12780 [Bombiscardovia nodaiensis]|uniref:Uncharacterized protein n=1 Tax=Bombiscardovia nodaiensis TaxID=2932181 RepID=A0ABN6SE05_9BIFI|nr:hypothetical protein KIM372_12780 [Bombiscardovia nodaiensis]